MGDLKRHGMTFRLTLALLLSVYTTATTAVELSFLGGSQGGGEIEYIDTGSTLNFADDAVRAVVFSVPRGDEKSFELFYSRQHTRLEEEPLVPAGELMDLDVNYLHFGGALMSEQLYGLQGFLTGGLGITHYNPSLSGAAAENRVSMSLGLGARWMPSDRVGLRLEGRLFGTLFNSNTVIFCSGGCSFAVSGELLNQYAILGGLVIRFD